MAAQNIAFYDQLTQATLVRVENLGTIRHGFEVNHSVRRIWQGCSRHPVFNDTLRLDSPNHLNPSESLPPRNASAQNRRFPIPIRAKPGLFRRQWVAYVTNRRLASLADRVQVVPNARLSAAIAYTADGPRSNASAGPNDDASPAHFPRHENEQGTRA